MKNLLQVFAFTILLSIVLAAQPTIRVESIPPVGSSYVQYFCDTTGISDGTSGTNQTWDYSNLTLNDEDEPMGFIFDSPQKGEKSESFPDADIVQIFSDGSIFYKIESDQLVRLGVGYSEGIETLEDLSIVMKYPFTMNSSFEDEFTGQIIANTEAGEMTIDRSGSISMKADGYGTLIMPYGTLKNVLRVKMVQDIEDVLPAFIPGAPALKNKIYTVSYMYFVEGFTFPVLNIDHSVTDFENYPVPMEREFYNDITYIEIDADVVLKPSTPEMDSPSNGSTVDLPLTLMWNEAQLEEKVFHKGDEIQAEFNYVVQIHSDPTFVGLIEYEHFTNTTSYEISELTAGKTYYWRVAAQYEDKTSDWSEPWSFTVSESVVELPDPPALLLPENNATEQSLTPTFSWEANEGIINWDLMITTLVEDGDSTVYYAQDLTTNLHTITMELENNKLYYWGVRSFDGDNWGEWSEAFEFTTLDATSVSEIINAKDISISPNPISTDLKLSFDSSVNSNATITMIDLTGKVVFNIDNKQIHPGMNIFEIDVNNLNPGVYFLSVNGHKFSLSQKIIISK